MLKAWWLEREYPYRNERKLTSVPSQRLHLYPGGGFPGSPKSLSDAQNFPQTGITCARSFCGDLLVTPAEVFTFVHVQWSFLQPLHELSERVLRGIVGPGRWRRRVRIDREGVEPLKNGWLSKEEGRPTKSVVPVVFSPSLAVPLRKLPD